MLFLGDTGSVRCSAKWMGNSLRTDDPKKGFLGYKLDSMSGKNGVFAEWHFENNSLSLSNDEFGMFPVYYTEDRNGVALSSSIVDLLVSDRHRLLDDPAIAVFIRMGTFVADTTPFG